MPNASWPRSEGSRPPGGYTKSLMTLLLMKTMPRLSMVIRPTPAENPAANTIL